jgi:phosphonate transport system substrate-binding protein
MTFPQNSHQNHSAVEPVIPGGQDQDQQYIDFASFLGDNALEFYQQVVGYLAEATGIAAKLVENLSPQEQDRRVNSGQIQAVFTCGLPYVRKADIQPSLLHLIAAPVLVAQRYGNRPVYFSDIIVRSDSSYRRFEDLRDTIFAYNEGYSLSGYMAPCYHFLRSGMKQPFFGQTLCSGSHAISMDWVETGRATAAAIDSVVLEMELAQRPHRAKIFRVIDSIGPMPMPPVAASPGLKTTQMRQFRDALLNMHRVPAGQGILQRTGISRFAAVTDSDYDPIRQIIEALKRAGMTELA